MVFQVIALSSLCLASLACLLACISLVITIALKNSTHKIMMYDPSKQEFEHLPDQEKINIQKQDPRETLE